MMQHFLLLSVGLLYSTAHTLRSDLPSSTVGESFAGAPANLHSALDKMLDELWHLQARAGVVCPGHVFVTGNAAGAGAGAVGMADRLRGVVIGAILAAATGRQLHVDPGLMGALYATSTGSFAELMQRAARVRSASGCAEGIPSQNITAVFHDPALCFSSDLMREGLASQATVVVLASNCFAIPFPSPLRSAVPPSQQEAVAAFNACEGHVPALYLNQNSIKAEHHANTPHLRSVLQAARQQCPTAGMAAAGSRHPSWMVQGPPLQQASIPPAHLASCGALPRSVACSTLVLHRAWGARVPALAALLQQAVALHRSWEAQLAPAGYTVLHLRAAQLQLRVQRHCAVPSVPWADPVPPSWQTAAVGDAWLQQLLRRVPVEAAATAHTGLPPPVVVVLSDSAWLQQAVARALQGRARVVSCCAPPVHSGRLQGAPPPSATAAARQALFDLITIANANVLIHGRGMFWAAGVFWLGWGQGPVLVEAWQPKQVPVAAAILTQPWPRSATPPN